MDGKGAWRDNVFVERLWRTVKYEEVYLHGYDSVPDARASIGRYLDLYNRRRPHSSLDGMTPIKLTTEHTACRQSAWRPISRQAFHFIENKNCPNERDHLSLRAFGNCTVLQPRGTFRRLFGVRSLVNVGLACKAKSFRGKGLIWDLAAGCPTLRALSL